MKIKVCGITTVDQLQQLESLGVDYAGLIFYKGSKRYAHEKLHNQNSEIKKLEIKKVGVFVNGDMGFLKSLVRDYGLSDVQLHGDEPPEFCAQLQNTVDVIKVFRISDQTTDLDKLVAPFQNSCTYFLFDTDTETYGGSGKRFDWNLLQNAKISKPFFLSGGIAPADMGILKSFSHPFLYAIDINSRFEERPGIKDIGKIKSFVNAIKQPLYG